jgi:hypothetical protein
MALPLNQHICVSDFENGLDDLSLNQWGKKLALEFMRDIFTNELSFLKTINIWSPKETSGTPF